MRFLERLREIFYRFAQDLQVPDDCVLRLYIISKVVPGHAGGKQKDSVNSDENIIEEEGGIFAAPVMRMRHRRGSSVRLRV
jgi:hypothetical protein